ncbi:hypothetical protein MRB53_038968 [Persea americana]|nr:hypothetical protein MRB53_038968 [Persea americana]
MPLQSEPSKFEQLVSVGQSIQYYHRSNADCSKHLLECLPHEKSKAFIITGSSLANKTQLIKQVEEVLGDRHAGTFSNIKQHAPVKDLDEAIELVSKQDNVDTVISIGGGSPIDSAKVISYRLNEKKKAGFLFHIAIPTTLSAAECTMGAGYTNETGMKTGVSDSRLAPHTILYDSTFALETPPWLFTSTGMRALDHAMEIMYHPTATEMPARQMCLNSAGHVVIIKAKTSPSAATQLARMAPFIGIARSNNDKEDAIAVGNAILSLVKDLDLQTTLTEKNVGKDQVDKIVGIATKPESEEVKGVVREMVENLY